MAPLKRQAKLLGLDSGASIKGLIFMRNLKSLSVAPYLRLNRGRRPSTTSAGPMAGHAAAPLF
jgi:hypothetical protein